MGEYEAEPLIETRDPVDEAVDLYEQGVDPAALAAELLNTYGPTHEAMFVRRWHAEEQAYEEPEEIDARTYVQRRVDSVTAAEALGQANAEQAELEAQAAAVQAHQEMVAEQAAAFFKRHPEAAKRDDLYENMLALAPADLQVETPEDVARLFESTYQSSVQIDRAERAALIEKEADDHWFVHEDGFMGSQAPEKKPYEALVAKHLRQAYDAAPGRFLPPPTKAQDEAQTIGEWDAMAAPHEDGWQVNAQPGAGPARESFHEPGSHEAMREAALEEGWSV
jgi:hypothetical protein